MKDLSRRELLASAASAAAITAIPNWMVPKSSMNRWQGANDRLTLGLIGCGGMGASNMRSLMNFDDVDVAAVCDVDSNRMPGDIAAVEKKYGRKPAVYSDYRKMLERKDIDAIIVGSPDHWHALHLIHTVEAGKDSYCEKPISHNLVEAVSMAAAAKRYNRIVQVGTWQRSTREFTDAIDFVRSGGIGKIALTRAWISDNTQLGKTPRTDPPKGFDYDTWVGPAAFREYHANQNHWNWRWIMNYGGGLTTDWGVHMMDIAMLGMSKGTDLVMPTEVTTEGGLWAFTDDDRDAPDTIMSVLKFQNPNFIMQWSVGRDNPGRPGHGTEFVSTDGRTVRVWRGGWVILDPEGKEIAKPSKSENPPNHWRDFVDRVKDRKEPRASLMSVAQTTVVCHLVNASLMSGETVKFDKAKMDIVGKAGKNTSAYRREYRKPYSLPIYKL